MASQPQPYQQQAFGGAKPLDMKTFQPFADAAYGSATSRLDPQWQQARSTFEQDMVNRGIGPGNQAYGNASESFERSKADAYAGARNDALAQALAAQGQAYQQDANTYALNQGERQFGSQMDFNQGRADMSDLMSLLGYGSSVTAQNNATLNADQQRAMGLLGLIPGMSPTPIDAQGAANSWMSQYNTNRQINSNDANARNAAWVQLASAFMG